MRGLLTLLGVLGLAFTFSACLGDDDDTTVTDDDDATGDDDDVTGDDDDVTGDDDDATGDDDDATTDDDDATTDDDDATTDDDDDATTDDDDTTPEVCLDDINEEDDVEADATDLGATGQTLSGLTLEIGDPDWFVMDACADALIDLSSTATDTVELTLFAGDGTELASDGASVSWAEGTEDAPLLSVEAVAAVCIDYSLTYDIDESGCCAQDGAEPNDDTGVATQLTTGVAFEDGGLVGTEQDWFAVDACPGADVTVELTPSSSGEVFDVVLWSDVGVVIEERLGVTGAQTFTVTGGADNGYTVQLANLVSEGCLGYDLLATVDVTGCPTPCLPDAFEEDDAPGDPTGSISATTTVSGLTSIFGDTDYIAFEVCPEAVVTFEAIYDTALGTIDLDVTDAIGIDLTSSPAVPLVFEPTYGGMYWLRAEMLSGTCLDYSVDVTIDDTACTTTCWDDLFEPNDDATTPFGFADGDWAPYLQVLDTSPDWFSVELCDGAEFAVELSFVHADGDINAQLVLADGTVLADGLSTTDDELLSYSAVGAQSAFLEVSLNDTGCNDYQALVLVDDATCPALCGEDGWEENDDQASAQTLPLPSVLGPLYAPLGDDDWFTVDVCGGGVLVASVSGTGFDPVGLSLVDDLGADLATPTATADGWEASWTATVDAAAWIEVSTTGATCSEYTLDVSVDETGCCADDANEPDDAVGDAVAVTESVLVTGLNQSVGNDDWFSIELCAGAILDVEALTDYPAANVDLYLQDAAAAPLVSADGFASYQSLSYTSVAGETVSLQVTSVWGDCSDYEIDFVIDTSACPP